MHPLNLSYFSVLHYSPAFFFISISEVLRFKVKTASFLKFHIYHLLFSFAIFLLAIVKYRCYSLLNYLLLRSFLYIFLNATSINISFRHIFYCLIFYHLYLTKILLTYSLKENLKNINKLCYHISNAMYIITSLYISTKNMCLLLVTY